MKRIVRFPLGSGINGNEYFLCRREKLWNVRYASLWEAELMETLFQSYIFRSLCWYASLWEAELMETTRRSDSLRRRIRYASLWEAELMETSSASS